MIPTPQPIFRSGDLGGYLTEVLGGIQISNGYETDVGTRVFRGKIKNDETILPYCTIVEGEDRPDDQGEDKVLVWQQYAIGAYLACDPDNPSDAANAAIRDIKRAIFTRGTGPARPRLGNRVRRVRYLGKDIGPRADGRPIVFAIVHFEVQFVEDLVAKPGP